MTASSVMALMPLVILVAGCVLCLLAGALRPGGYLYEAAIAVISASLLWAVFVPAEGVLPGLSITEFSRSFIVFFNGAGIVALLLASCYNRRRGIVGEEFPSTVVFALVGIGATCAATNLLMLFLGLEAFTFAFYILVAIERNSSRGGEAGLKYLLNGTVSASIMSMGIALIYCSSGTLKLAELTSRAGSGGLLFVAGMCLVLLGLGFKLSLVPAHLWTPDVYQGAPAPVTALLSTASKGASVAALLLLVPLLSGWRASHDILWWLSLLSMVFGNLAALVQTSLKRMLAWSSIAQMGYTAMAFVALPAGGARAAAFYAAVYVAAGLASFGAVAVMSGTAERDLIEDYRGLGYRNPLAGAALAVALFSLAGIPPAAGFMAKFAVFAAALRGGETALALAGIISALVAVFYYLRIVVALYMKPPELMEAPPHSLTISEAAALVIPTLATFFMGVYPSPVLDLLTRVITVR